MPEEAWMVEIELFHDRVPNPAVYLFPKIRGDEQISICVSILAER